MTKITIDRAVVEQALEALEMSRRFVYADNSAPRWQSRCRSR
jgi:hypothetical protein